MLHHFSSPPSYGLDLFLLPLLPFPNIAPPHLKADPLTPATSRSYGLDLFLLSIDEGISGYRDDSLETVKRNEAQYQVGAGRVGWLPACPAGQVGVLGGAWPGLGLLHTRHACLQVLQGRRWATCGCIMLMHAAPRAGNPWHLTTPPLHSCPP